MAFIAKTIFCWTLILAFHGATYGNELDFDPYAFYKLRARSNGVLTPTVRQELKTDLSTEKFTAVASTSSCGRLLLAEIPERVALRSLTQITGKNGNDTTVYFDPVDQTYFEQVLPLAFFPRIYGTEAFKEIEGLSIADETIRTRKRFIYDTFRYVLACFAAGLDPDPLVVETSMGRKVLTMLWARMNSPTPGIREISSVDVRQDLLNALGAWQAGTLSDGMFLEAAIADHGFQWAFGLTALLKFSNAVDIAVAKNNGARLRLLSEYGAAVINRKQNLQGPQSPGGVPLAHRRLFPSR